MLCIKYSINRHCILTKRNVARYLQHQRENLTHFDGLLRLVARYDRHTKRIMFLMVRHDLQTKWNDVGLLVIWKFITAATVYRSRWFAATNNDCNDEGMHV